MIYLPFSMCLHHFKWCQGWSRVTLEWTLCLKWYNNAIQVWGWNFCSCLPHPAPPYHHTPPHPFPPSPCPPTPPEASFTPRTSNFPPSAASLIHQKAISVNIHFSAFVYLNFICTFCLSAGERNLERVLSATPLWLPHVNNNSRMRLFLSKVVPLQSRGPQRHLEVPSNSDKSLVPIALHRVLTLHWRARFSQVNTCFYGKHTCADLKTCSLACYQGLLSNRSERYFAHL